MNEPFRMQSTQVALRERKQKITSNAIGQRTSKYLIEQSAYEVETKSYKDAIESTIFESE